MSLDDLIYWHWWIIAVVLLILEVFAPGAIFLWMGIAAAVVGVVLWLIPSMIWEIQFLIFSVISVASIVIWHKYLKKNPISSDQPTLNQRSTQYINRTFTLEDPIKNGIGKIRVDDSTWKIEGPDSDAGTQIKVVAVDGVILKVEAV